MFVNKLKPKHMKKNYFITAVLLFNLSIICAQTKLASWNGTNTSTAIYPREANEIDTEIGAAFESYNGLNVNTDNRNVWDNPSSSTTVDPETSPFLSYFLHTTSNINFDRFVLGGAASIGGSKIQLRWSIDNFSSVLGEFEPLTTNYQLVSVDLSSTAQVPAGDIEFRVYFYHSAGSLFNPGNYNYSSPDGTSSTYQGNYGMAVSVWAGESSLDVEKINNSAFSLDVYPNPSNDYIKVSGLKKNYNYTICNIIGAKLQQGIINNHENTLKVSELTPGIYLLLLDNGSSVRFVKN